MSTGLKQRLVGAVVLIALAVIFVPMFLGGPVQRTRVDLPIEVPPRPEVAPARALPPEGLLDRSSPGASLAEVPEPIEAPAPPSSPPAIAEPEDSGDMPSPVPEPEAPGTPPPDASSPPLEPTPAPEADAAPPPEESPSTAELAAWAVQVGAFGQQDNAMGLRDRLRAADFPAYVDRVPGDNGVLHRVRLGPVGSRDEAASLARRAREQADLEGIIVSR